ncbi:unnamed protein product [Kuraishia capsulata CBS 1993]|uniref:NOT2/NOT3/NOT5 C-terminal domain-containing protein n=1 Tax=Kuraishia capsulata CBS 1993 TaxID=1382522 RepID=W6MJ98_9ASCO|nr:uncharacterized protein KUCA_T00000455001 [Kuraishia capsulata CBS 1993]CDK24492.1 unnamed protein product [Kuraishia capsulata CBS 1993]
MDKYGLKGLLGMIKMENNDQTMIANGTDLSMIGLDMDPKHTKGKISRFFASPWVETSRSEVEPDFVKPASFELSDLSQPEEQMRKFNDETLFFIFYTKTRDIMQELAARELFNRNWRYHKDLQVWLTKDSQVEPIQNTPQSERGVYIFFDPHTWESVRKEFVLFYQSIM